VTANERRTARRLLTEVHGVLRRIAALIGDGRGPFDASEARRHQLRYLWIVAGSILKNYTTTRGLPPKRSVFSPIIGFRQYLAYYPPQEIDDDVVWQESAAEVRDWLARVADARRSLR
jgi:hypothetical protein